MSASVRRRVAVLTGTRADYGLLRWIALALREQPDFELAWIVTGSHLAPAFGRTVAELRADGFQPADEVEILTDSDTGVGTAKAMGLGLIGFADALRRLAPDMLVLLGDRFEAMAAAAAAACCRVPVAHLCGGEVTEGALDEGWRHAITKLAHLHLPATDAFARRIVAMGEDPNRVHVVGSPGVEAARRLEPLPEAELCALAGLPLRHPTLLVTLHPETASDMPPAAQAEALLAALDGVGADILFTSPNADAGGREIHGRIQAYVRRHHNARLVGSLGSRAYLSLLGRVDAVVGNSSSALIEAPVFELPAVNVGDRQKGRPRAANVIDAGWNAGDIRAAVKRALSASFRASLRGLENPYGDGRTSERVVAALRGAPARQELLRKRFRDGG